MVKSDISLNIRIYRAPCGANNIEIKHIRIFRGAKCDIWHLTSQFSLNAGFTELLAELIIEDIIHLMLPKVTKRYQALPKVAKLYQKVTKLTISYQSFTLMFSKVTESYQKLPKGTKFYKNLPKALDKYSDWRHWVIG